MTSLILVSSVVFVVFLGLVKLILDLSRISIFESPAILETPGKPESAEGLPAKTTESNESNPKELSNTQ